MKLKLKRAEVENSVSNGHSKEEVKRAVVGMHEVVKAASATANMSAIEPVTDDEEDIFCTIKREDVPPVPDNKFLMRGAVQQQTAALAHGPSETAAAPAAWRGDTYNRHEDRR
jgi:hypothetical protein